MYAEAAKVNHIGLDALHLTGADPAFWKRGGGGVLGSCQVLNHRGCMCACGFFIFTKLWDLPKCMRGPDPGTPTPLLTLHSNTSCLAIVLKNVNKITDIFSAPGMGCIWDIGLF